MEDYYMITDKRNRQYDLTEGLIVYCTICIRHLNIVENNLYNNLYIQQYINKITGSNKKRKKILIYAPLRSDTRSR